MEKLVIIPTYNERENIETILQAIYNLRQDFHVLVIDDGSPDQPTSSNENGEGEPHVLEGRNTEATQEPRPGSKQALIVSLMQQAGGATLEALIKATDWLPHTTRAALTGLRKKGYTIEKTKGEDGKTRQSDALLLSAGHLTVHTVHELAEANAFESLARPGAAVS